MIATAMSVKFVTLAAPGRSSSWDQSVPKFLSEERETVKMQSRHFSHPRTRRVSVLRTGSEEYAGNDGRVFLMIKRVRIELEGKE